MVLESRLVFFFFLAALHGLQDLGSLTREGRTQALSNEKAEYQPLDHQGIPSHLHSCCPPIRAPLSSQGDLSKLKDTILLLKTLEELPMGLQN